MDFLEHEMAEMTLVGDMIRSAQQRGHPLLASSGRVVQLNAEGREQGNLSIFKGKNGAGETGQGWGVTGAEELTLTKPDQQRSRFAGNNQRSRNLLPDHSQGVSPVQLRKNGLDGFQQTSSGWFGSSTQPSLELGCNEMGNDLGIGLRCEAHTVSLQ